MLNEKGTINKKSVMSKNAGVKELKAQCLLDYIFKTGIDAFGSKNKYLGQSSN